MDCHSTRASSFKILFLLIVDRFVSHSAGEAVDCLAKDCWWEGYVHAVHPDHVTVTFLSMTSAFTIAALYFLSFCSGLVSISPPKLGSECRRRFCIECVGGLRSYNVYRTWHLKESVSKVPGSV